MALHLLTIGINDYPGAESDLGGCLNDARDWRDLFAPLATSNTLILDRAATKAAIVAGLSRTMTRLKPKDWAVVSYSGHGSWTPDRDGDEPDGRDECLCPYDPRHGVITDDELRRIFLSRTPSSKVLFITDSCHSGTVFQMLGRPGSIRPRFMPPAKFLAAGTERKRAASMAAMAVPVKSDAPLPNIVHLAGCKDSEYSYDAEFEGRPNGALTYFAIRAYQSLPEGATFKAWMLRIARSLPTYDFPQTPRLNADAQMLANVLPGK